MSSGFRVEVGPDDLASAARRLEQTGRARLPFLLGHETTRALYQAVRSPDLPWVRTFDGAGETAQLAADVDAMSPMDRQALMASVHRQAADQFQYLFDRLAIQNRPGRRQPLPDDLHRLVALFSGTSFLSFTRQLTGDERISFVDAQMTRYLPGHFLNRHSDAHERSGRLYAYVLNLSPLWRAEWGGLLQFFDGEGEVDQTYTPQFGSLSVFRVPQMHAVSSLAAFAPVPRYAVTGWWRAVPSLP